MPIYAYKCESCAHAKDVLQKISDPLLTVCPACGQSTFKKQLTSAGFQLKGSGWYVTDFRGGDAKKPGDAEGDRTEAKPSEVKAAASSDAATSPSNSASADGKSSASAAGASTAAPSAPAATAAAPKAASNSATPTSGA